MVKSVHYSMCTVACNGRGTTSSNSRYPVKANPTPITYVSLYPGAVLHGEGAIAESIVCCSHSI